MPIRTSIIADNNDIADQNDDDVDEMTVMEGWKERRGPKMCKQCIIHIPCILIFHACVSNVALSGAHKNKVIR